MIRVKQMYRTEIACPVRWEGVTNDDKSIVITYRYGKLKMTVGGRNCFSKKVGKPADGYLAPWELFKHVSHLLKWAKGIPHTCEEFIQDSCNGRLAVMNGNIMSQAQAMDDDPFFADCIEQDFFADCMAQEEEFSFNDLEDENYEFNF